MGQVVSIGGVHTSPIHLYAPKYIHMPLYTPHIHLYIPPIPYVPCMSVGLGGNCTPYMSWGLLGGISTSVRLFCVSTSICLSVHKSYQLLPIIVGCFLLDWMPMDVCYVSCSCSFLCSVFIMSQACTTMAKTTAPPVTVVYSSTSSLLSTVTMAPSLMWLPATSGQHDVVLLALVTPRHSGGVVGLATMLQQQPPPQMPIQLMPIMPWVSTVSLPLFCIFICLVSNLVYTFLLSGAMLDAIFTYGGSTIDVCTTAALGAYPLQAYVEPGNGLGPHQVCTESLLPLLL